jgi:hypothetical protein
MELVLREETRCYDTRQLLCTECGRDLPVGAKRCHPCRNTQLLASYCTSKTRVAEYFEVLRTADLWPTVGCFATCSVSQISSRFIRTRESTRHACVGSANCPLARTLCLMRDKAKESQAWTNGLCLQCVREGEDGEGDLCDHD